MEIFRYYFFNFTLLDALDILIVAYIVYRFIGLMHGTRALSMLIGAGIILFLAFLSSWLDMGSLKWLIARLGTVWVIAFLVVFQPELRNILTRIGNTPFFRRFVSREAEKAIKAIVDAVAIFSNTKTGALIAVKRDVGLKGYEETGKPINAEVTAELLVTLFTPHTPLHDGAVIIENDRIISAGCELPLTTSPHYQRALGMRHRAGLGLSEETDAVVIIVSEETGAVSVALRGHLRQNISIENLQKLLEITLKGKQ